MKSVIILFLSVALLTGCSHSTVARSQSHKLKGLYDNDSEGFASNAFDDEFISLEEQDLNLRFADAAIPQPKEIPGAYGSGVPSLDQFKKALAGLAQIFQNVHFNTDEHVLRNPDDLLVIQRAADYLKKHPNTYVSVGGHCDERASEAYNLALGTRRANYIRTLLIQRGVDPNKIHSVSYGKEHPEVFGHNASAWAINRRAEFKIFERE